MQDLSNSIATTSIYLLPWVALLAGLGGSVHCVGMCGGLVTACAPTKKSVFTYQLGRLGGYSLLALLGGFIGEFLRLRLSTGALSIVPALMIGTILIFFGLQSLRGKSAHVKLPNFVESTHRSLWKKAMVVFKDQYSAKSFTVGLLSIMLPCGLLYGVVISLSALQNPLLSVLMMFFFWLGTLPAMGVAPTLFKKLISPMLQKMPKAGAILLICIGLMTISYRVYALYQVHSCH
ncbi:DsbD family 2 [Bacteriovorax sp. BSW11_IV]|uniref:sulfite exporter TauE/SafE family protein n=1 Tax=Bacteriovorax sp. BSW11_IV TaxID=1353529 RepID=UPI00038A4402|nr:sulfite exporter TauE/SafE family protein [Bacteriovorax sp. BSW11_IV]EQC43057.1 DsbD family 2 [Bacteriovorax sp. BSW11_IV]